MAARHILAIGRLRETPEGALYARYAARLRPRPILAELPEAAGAEAEIKRREAAALIAALPARGFAIALDPAGTAPDSEGFAALLARWDATGRPLAFLIGGAAGLDRAVLDRADAALSLGAMTWPHFLVRAMLAEQLYRAQAIATGHPYHRAGRP
ncbi:MAG: 23S rRNA (pseudouridine(1915)-N(3))-methyltransferase RlmH [Rhodospirillales bacterium]|nr:23S rRNA (pseudouridine(1915)-N(3))-methyltransferase RlmH [Rhodospirillales bacterium]